MSMRTASFLFLACICASFAARAEASDCHPSVPLSDMKLTFDEEFKVGKLDRKVWNVHARHIGGINGEVQAYAPDAYDMVPGGGIRLRADKREFEGKHYTSGEITTAGGFSQTYGHFEMKAKLPAVNGAWPAFWLLPENGAWPPEIDVLEYIYRPWGAPIRKYNPSYAHFGLFWPPHLASVTWKPANNSPWNSNSEVYLTDNYKRRPTLPDKFDGDMTTEFHTYAVDWRPGELSFSVDGKERMCWVEGADTRGTVPNIPMYMIANLAIAKGPSDKPGWPGKLDADQAFPFYMDIAYIRAYQFKDVPKISPLPVDIGIPSLSSHAVKPGDTLKIHTDLKIGDVGLSQLNARMIITGYHGKRHFAETSFHSPGYVAAHSKFSLKMEFGVPEDMEPGVYVLDVLADWPGGSISNNFATEFTVIGSH